jgi:hypothetical protein
LDDYRSINGIGVTMGWDDRDKQQGAALTHRGWKRFCEVDESMDDGYIEIRIWNNIRKRA